MDNTEQARAEALDALIEEFERTGHISPTAEEGRILAAEVVRLRAQRKGRLQRILEGKP
jgi:hypothetical protein